MVGASYTRKSVKDVNAISIAEQNARIEQFAKKHGFKIAKKYSDRKESAESEEAFLEMKEDAIRRKYDCIFVWSYMFFGKDPMIGYDLLRYTFLPAGIGFAIVSDGFISVGKTREEIEAYLSRKYEERRVANSRGYIRKALEGQPNRYYGYMIVDDVYVFDEKVKPIVDCIFSMALEGRRAKEIAEKLNERGIEPPHLYLLREAGKSTLDVAKKWRGDEIKRILSSSKYKGLLRAVRSGKETFIPVPAYISDEQYEKLNGGKTSLKRKVRWDNPLAGKVFDKGSGLTMNSGDRLNTGKYYYYMGRHTEETRKYKKKFIPAAEVFTEVERAMISEHKAALNVQRIMDTSDEVKTEFLRDTEELRKEIGEVFEQMLCCADSKNTEELKRLDEHFSEVQKDIRFYRTAYSPQNPWLRLYINMEDEPLSRHKAKKYIEKVLVEECKQVEFIPCHIRYKECLPKNWMEV